MRVMEKQTEFVNWLRSVAPYVHAFRGKTFVVAFPGELVTAGGLQVLAQDLSLLHALGIRVVVEGTRPTSPALYPAKHQAMFETMELQRMLGAPAMVLKRELANIPLWGWAVRKYGAIVVDRSASAKAMRGMMRDAQVAVGEGRAIMIFPEGTRVKPGETPPLKPGFAGLYRMLNLPVVPVATDSGLVWPRKGLKRPGVVTLRFGEVIPPGLPRAEAEARVHAAMNALESSPARGGGRA
jgi:1-acyl-sn-glycerol-3-phosphate acyltransferase